MRYFLLLLYCLSIQLSSAQPDLSPSKKAVKNYTKANDLIKERNFEEAILLYKKAISKDEKFSQAYFRLASAYTILRKTDSAFRYYDLYRQVTPLNTISSRNVFFLANLYFENGQYELAKSIISESSDITQEWRKDQGKKQLFNNIEYAINGRLSPVNYTIEILPPSVNMFYSQYFPAVTIDGNNMFYTRRNGSSQFDDEDLVVSRFVDGEWSEAVSISRNINSKFNEGACTISADGRILIFTSCEESNSYGSCDLFITKKQGDNWTKPRNLGKKINSIYWESQPSLSADGKSIYFSSNRPGGKGQRDLWVSYSENNIWRVPINLGGNVNTPSDETTPYIHSNNQTLFFSSNGHLGYGGYDLFVSEFIGDSIWSSPSNLGYGLNDHNDQLSLIISADGRGGYFAQEKINEEGFISSKLARINFEEDTLVRSRASYVTGKVMEARTKKPLAANIELYDLQSSKIIYETDSDPITGSYFFVLTENKEFGAFASSDGYLFEDFRFEVGENSLLDPDTIDIYLNPIEVGINLILENIYFEFDSYELVPKSIAELNVIADFLQDHDILVEISGHTDEVGSDDYNDRLSLQRAQAVNDYLVENGVNQEKLVFKGYGSKKPKFLEEEEKFKNRRIEFEILKVNTPK